MLFVTALRELPTAIAFNGGTESRGPLSKDQLYPVRCFKAVLSDKCISNKSEIDVRLIHPLAYRYITPTIVDSSRYGSDQRGVKQ